MLPLISLKNEIIFLKKIVEKSSSCYKNNEYKFGIMIETPRAAFLIEEMLKYIDFICFGTNDLTQMFFGYSRDDSHFLENYQESGIISFNPFDEVDLNGVGLLMQNVCNTVRDFAKNNNKKIEIGVCGEHVSNAKSLNFFIENCGVDYISCSSNKLLYSIFCVAKKFVNF